MIEDFFYPDAVVDKWTCKFPEGNFIYSYMRLRRRFDLLPDIDVLCLEGGPTDFPEQDIIQSMDKWYMDKRGHGDMRYRLVLSFPHARSIMQQLSDTQRLLVRLGPAHLTLNSVLTIVQPTVNDRDYTFMCLEIGPNTLGVWSSFLSAAAKKEQCNEQARKEQEQARKEQEQKVASSGFDDTLSFEFLEQLLANNKQ